MLTGNSAKRYRDLLEACEERDGLYMIRQLYYCFISSTANTNFISGLLNVKPAKVELTFTKLRQFTPEEVPGHAHLEFLSNSPSDLGSPRLLQIGFDKQQLPQAREFVRTFADYWHRLIKSAKKEKCPFRAWQLIYFMQCRSYGIRELLILFRVSCVVTGVRDHYKAEGLPLWGEDEELEERALSNETEANTLAVHRYIITTWHAKAAWEARKQREQGGFNPKETH